MSILRRSDTKKLFGSVMYVIDNGEITRLIKSTWIISEPQSGMPKSINSQNANTEIAKKSLWISEFSSHLKSRRSSGRSTTTTISRVPILRRRRMYWLIYLPYLLQLCLLTLLKWILIRLPLKYIELFFLIKLYLISQS